MWREPSRDISMPSKTCPTRSMASGGRTVSNPVERLAAAVRMPSESAQEWASRALGDLCADPAILAVVLFGSSVRPVERSSDLDCLVIYSGRRPVLPSAPTDVDVRYYEARDVPRLIREGHDLLGWALRLGAPVCERE